MLVLPLVLIWSAAYLVYRAQELRNASQSMVSAAMRLVRPQDIATEGSGFAIPVDLVRGVVEELKMHGRVIRGYLGLLPDDLTSAERKEIGLDNDRGILITEVIAGGPAERAGLQVNDVLLSINGEAIAQERQALLIAASTKPGDEIELVFWRDGERLSTTAIATERPREQPQR